MTADNAFVQCYVDTILSVGTTNAVANQVCWANNQQASIGVPANGYNNLLLDDPVLLTSIMYQAVNNVIAVQFWRKSYEIEAMLTNCESNPVEIWEYRCQARRDQPNGVTLQGMMAGGFSDANAGYGSQKPLNSPVILGATPYMNPRVTAQYKIVKVRKRLLRPSQTWKIRYALKRPRKYTNESLNPASVVASTAYEVLKGQRISLFIANGTYCTNAGANATYKAGIGNVNIGIVYKIRIHYSYISDTTVSTGTNQTAAGFSSRDANCPAPIVVNHPDSALPVIGYTAGLGTSGTYIAGTRVYGTENYGLDMQDFKQGDAV